jgi:hypothetical protein
MLDQHKSHIDILGQEFKKRGQRLQTARGCTDTHDVSRTLLGEFPIAVVRQSSSCKGLNELYDYTFIRSQIQCNRGARPGPTHLNSLQQ